ncbi:gpr180 [Symbiodinium pilosum]|uniref:Gpr180 protein n=1 Tax=Symbiodinium pilosum TaxID=2952 RepID=A0A812UJF8_SYMPI|nr:gpr180 [Symbiodinium pilosum]
MCPKPAEAYPKYVNGAVGLTSLTVTSAILALLIGGILAMVFLGNEVNASVERHVYLLYRQRSLMLATRFDPAAEKQKCKAMHKDPEKLAQCTELISGVCEELDFEGKVKPLTLFGLRLGWSLCLGQRFSVSVPVKRLSLGNRVMKALQNLATGIATGGFVSADAKIGGFGKHFLRLRPRLTQKYTGAILADFDYVIPKTQTFAFRTASHPPTFLVGIQPQQPHTSAQWQVSLHPAGKSGSLASSPPTLSHGWGSRYQVVTERREEPAWEGFVNLKSKYADETRIDVFVVDSRIAHLEDIHQQKQCSFEGSWQNFSEREQGRHHRVLSFTESATGCFLLVQLVLAGVVLRRFFLFVDTGKLLSRVIVFKFFAQDFPQQMCIAAYLYAWYAENGLRCQMCLFHPSHCDDQHPLHSTNLLVCLFTLLSAVANQLLFQARLKPGYDSEDECVVCFFRFVMVSVSILPFTTAMCMLSAVLLHLKSVLIYFLIGVPTVLGWGTIVCVPLFVCCDDEL